MSEIPPVRQRMTIDEIGERLTDIANSTDAGADKFRALKMLADMNSATVTLPKPMDDDEVVLLLGKLMKGFGRELTMSSYKYAFPAKINIEKRLWKRTYANATPEQKVQARQITSLKMLNRTFPEMKVNGIPAGYPAGRSQGAKIAWVQDQALKFIVERENASRAAAHESMTGLVSDDERATEGSPDDESQG